MIRDTYAEFIMEKVLKDMILDGESPTSAEIDAQFDEFTASNDISEALFKVEDYSVSEATESSASLYNNTNAAILQDLQVLYRHLIKISDQSVRTFHRWRTEAQLLEGRLTDLNERISTLLLLAEDTAGYLNFLQDNFVDTSKTDLTNTTAYVNVDKQAVCIGTSAVGATRYDLTSLENKDITFTILSRNYLVSTVSSEGSQLRYVTDNATNYWQERVYTSKPIPVSIELKIDLKETKEISRIDIDLHAANVNSSMQVTPMYSTDNYNYSQLPVTNFTRSIVDKSTFQFSPITTRWVKFVMTKLGYDIVHNDLYAYEFGVDEISFYNEGFEPDTEVTLISNVLSVTDVNGDVQPFSKVVLEVCEDVPTNTRIDYYVAASTTSTLPATATFTPIDPLNRESSTQPTILDFGDLDKVTVSGISVSYAPAASLPKFINPDQDFTLIESISTATAVTASAVASDVRYAFYNQNDRILDYQMETSITRADGTVELWRNVNLQGVTNKVRGISNGWRFEDPYYKTTVYVDNANGTDIDFGGKAVIIDEVSTTGTVNIPQGNHIIYVHKDNWKEIDRSSVVDLVDLKAADSLYPYNHRYLVEGFYYPAAYPTTDEEIYVGFDIVAEYLMKEVSVFDMMHNITVDDYSRYAIDRDALDIACVIDGSPTTKNPTDVFVVKVDENNSDSPNEKFLLKFKSVNTLYNYLRFKAVLKTSDSSITPFLDSYRIKIAS
jgi:hypothetical protein